MTKQKFTTKASTETYAELLNQFNAIRTEQKKISDFKTVAEWMAYGKATAEKKADLLAKMSKLA